MSFSCPHFRLEDEYCLRLKALCVPGRPGCVLGKSTVFATPAAQRIREHEATAALPARPAATAHKKTPAKRARSSR